MLELIVIEVNIIFKLFLGVVLYDLGRNEEAILDFTNAIDINPHYAEAYYNRGKYYFKNIF